MAIKNIFIISLFLILPIFSFADNHWIESSADIDPHLQDIVYIAEDDSFYYRLLLFRGGFEHITVKIVVQKYTIDYSDMENPYKLSDSIFIDELGTAHNLDVDSVSENKGEYEIHLSGVNTYSYEDVEVLLTMDKDLNYKVEISSDSKR